MQITTPLLIATGLMLGCATGCSGQPAADEIATPETTAAMVSHATNNGGTSIVSGSVVETMDSGGYTYVRVDTGDEEIWAAAGQFEIAVGDRVSFPLETPMQDFHSNTLDRDFELIYFASFIVPEGELPVSNPQAAIELPPGHPTLDAFAMDQPPAGAAGAIAQPAGGMTIAEVWSNRAELSGSSVTVSGRVVKYNAAILGRNWFHIQDGSGELAEGTNDLTVTTTTDLAVGDVVTVTGIVATDRDFGAGYTYTVMLEDAAVEKQ